ncbi:nitrite/sulfite reductase, partial [Anaerospora hongkongensis]
MKWQQDISKLNNVEKIKLEKDGLDVIHDIERYAELGFAAIDPADFDRLKWYGLYVQRPKSEGLFMLRVKLPGGGLTAGQARAVAAIAKDYTQDRLAITTRQSLQFHGLKVEFLPDIFKRLNEVGLSVVEAAGDCPRNIVSTPLAGIDKDEVLDPRPLITELNQFFEGNREFSNLPRKFKIAITGSVDNSIFAQINDLAFVPAVKEIEGQSVLGFHVLAGGGLSAKPALAIKLDVFVRPEQVLPVASATAALFRDYGYRESRHHARLKYLIQDWGKEKFTAELLALTGPLHTPGEEPAAKSAEGLFYGIHQQKQPGLNYAGLAIPAGQLTA